MLPVALISMAANIGPIATPANKVAWKWPKATFLRSGGVQSEAYAKQSAIAVVKEPHKPSARYPTSSHLTENFSGLEPTMMVISSPTKPPNDAQTMTGFLPTRSDRAPRCGATIAEKIPEIRFVIKLNIAVWRCTSLSSSHCGLPAPGIIGEKMNFGSLTALSESRSRQIRSCIR